MKPSDHDGSPLKIPIATIGISEAFAAKAVSNGYNTLEEILAIPLTELVLMDWFDEKMFKELAGLIKTYAIKQHT